MTQIVYVAHPLGGDVANNAKRARRWLRWLMDKEPEIAFCIPWLPYIDVGAPGEHDGPGAVDPDSLPEYRARCLRDDITIAERCDGIALMGPVLSPGMVLECRAVLVPGGWAADFITAIDPLGFGGHEDFAEAVTYHRPEWFDPAGGVLSRARRWWDARSGVDGGHP